MNLSPEELLLQKMHRSWKEALEPEFYKQYFKNLSKFILTEKKQHVRVYPPEEDVFSWTTDFPPTDVKVVIVGQDPYTAPGKAHGFQNINYKEPGFISGLAFSIKPGHKIPKSLQNIYTELEESLDDFQRPDHGYLKGWAREGVLLLNTVLTVREGVPNSHKYKGWEQFTDAVISYLNDKTSNAVFMLWGEYAQRKNVLIDKKRHHVLTAPHPSPLSANKGFFGCDHFSICNQYLREMRNEQIRWNNLPASSSF